MLKPPPPQTRLTTGQEAMMVWLGEDGPASGCTWMHEHARACTSRACPANAQRAAARQPDRSAASWDSAEQEHDKSALGTKTVDHMGHCGGPTALATRRRGMAQHHQAPIAWSLFMKASRERRQREQAGRVSVSHAPGGLRSRQRKSEQQSEKGRERASTTTRTRRRTKTKQTTTYTD